MSGVDLSVRWLGLELSNPFVCGASPLARDLDAARRLEDAGVAAMVTDSLFEERIVREEGGVLIHVERHTDSGPEAQSYQPLRDDLRFGPEQHLAQVQALSATLSVPVIASLNGSTSGGWLRYGKLLEQAGAAAIELNVYDLPQDPDVTGQQLHDRLVYLVTELAGELSIPLSVKLTPFHTSLPNLVSRLRQAGAAGVVLFNRMFEPDIDIEELELTRVLSPSRPEELRLRLNWLAVLSAQGGMDLAASGGVHSCPDAIKALMAGAHALQLVSLLLGEGPAALPRLRRELSTWLEQKGYQSVKSLRGCMDLSRCPDPTVYTRMNYMDVLQSWHGEFHPTRL